MHILYTGVTFSIIAVSSHSHHGCHLISTDTFTCCSWWQQVSNNWQLHHTYPQHYYISPISYRRQASSILSFKIIPCNSKNLKFIKIQYQTSISTFNINFNTTCMRSDNLQPLQLTVTKYFPITTTSFDFQRLINLNKHTLFVGALVHYKIFDLSIPLSNMSHTENKD